MQGIKARCSRYSILKIKTFMKKSRPLRPRRSGGINDRDQGETGLRPASVVSILVSFGLGFGLVFEKVGNRVLPAVLEKKSKVVSLVSIF